MLGNALKFEVVVKLEICSQSFLTLIYQKIIDICFDIFHLDKVINGSDLGPLPVYTT